MLKIICDTKKCGNDIKKIVAKPKPGDGVQVGKQHFCYDCLCSGLDVKEQDVGSDFKIN